jgi:hypothetical protein
VIFRPVRELFLPQHALSPPLIAAIDSAARRAIYYRHGWEGRFNAKSGNSARSEKANSYIFIFEKLFLKILSWVRLIFLSVVINQ